MVLPATLWLLAAITVAAGYLSLWTSRAVDDAARLGAGVEAELAITSTQQTLLYLLATHPFNYGGLSLAGEDPASRQAVDPLLSRSLEATGNEVRLDGTPYAGLGEARFAIQDQGGLVGLNALNPLRLERLLGQLGVPANQRQVLVARLQDYIDHDDLHRLNGAEAPDYRKRELPPPANRPLIAPWEARKVLGWNEQSALWDRQALPRLTSAKYGYSVNLNTSPVEVLQTIHGLGRKDARRLVEARPLKSLTQASLVLGRPLNVDPMATAFLSTDVLRISVWHPRARHRRVLAIELTPSSFNGRPWITEYELDFPLVETQPRIAPRTPASPLFSP